MSKNENSHWIATFLRYAIYVAAFVPLVIFSQFLSPFHFGKVIIFRSIVEVMAVFYLILILKNKKFLPPRNVLLYIFAGWTLFFGITTLTSVNPYLSFWGSLERMGGWWTFLHYFVYFVILISIFRTKEDWVKLLKITVFVGVLSALYGFGQKTNISFFIGSGNRARIFGTMGNAALFAGYQIVNMFLTLILAFSSSMSPKQRPYFFGAAAINFVAVLMTAVRGSILAVGIGFLIFVFLYYFFSSKSAIAKKALIGIVSLFVVFVGFAFAFKNSSLVKNSPYLSRLTDFSLQTNTVQTRFWAWQAGLEGWKETPKTILLGWGPENFNIPFSEHFNPKFFKGVGSETSFDRAHNMFVEILVTMGLFTFLIYVSMFVFALWLIWKLAFRERKIEKTTGIGLISLLAAYSIHNFFIFDTSVNFLVFFTVFGYIVFLASHFGTDTAALPDKNKKPVSDNLGAGLMVLMAVLLVVVAILIYETNILPAKANYITTRAIIASQNRDFDGAVAKFKEAVSYDVPGKYDYRHQYAQYILAYMNGRELGQKEISEIQFIISEVKKNVSENKQDYLPYLYLSRLYIYLGKSDPKSPYNDNALENSLKALEISPTFIRTYYEVAQAYLNKKDYGNAIKYFQKAVDLNPEVGLSHWYLGWAYLVSGDIAKGLTAAEEAMRRGYLPIETEYLNLINIYLKSNNFTKIAGLYETLIKINPSDPGHHAALAATYAKMPGRIDDAIKEAHIAAQLDKSYEPEARAFVQSLGRNW